MRRSCTSSSGFVRDERGTATAELAILLPLYLLLLLGSFQLADVSFAVHAANMEARRQAWGRRSPVVEPAMLAVGRLSGGMGPGKDLYGEYTELDHLFRDPRPFGLKMGDFDGDDRSQLLSHVLHTSVTPTGVGGERGWLMAIRGSASYSYSTMTSNFTGMIRLDDVELEREAEVYLRNTGAERPEINFKAGDEFKGSPLLDELNDGVEVVMPKPAEELKPYWDVHFDEDRYPNNE